MATQENVALWCDCIRAWYPDYDTKTYFIPPVVINKITFGRARESKLESQNTTPLSCVHPKLSSPVDSTLQSVLFCLQKWASHQSDPMFIISQLGFSNYMGVGQPWYAFTENTLTRPVDLPKQGKCDFDLILIHRRHGILIGEIKSVLSNHQCLKLSQQDADELVAESLGKAIKQLEKSEAGLRDVITSIEPKLGVLKTLVLPDVTANALHRVLSCDKQLEQDLVKCLQASNIDQAVEWCLLANNLFSPDNEMPNIQELHAWWTKRVAASLEINIPSYLYLDLLARLCGPAMTVVFSASSSIKVQPEEWGGKPLVKNITSLVLTPQQISLFVRAPTKVMLTGPPGVGKSVMLTLMALTWLRQGYDIDLVSVNLDSLAATCMINHMIEMTKLVDPTSASVVGNVRLHEYDFYNNDGDVEKAIDALKAASESEGLFVICDEFWADASVFDRYQRFVTGLCVRFPNIHLWVASTFHDLRPTELQEEKLTMPLRQCPLVVLDELKEAIEKVNMLIHPYSVRPLASPIERPPVIHLAHKGPVHTGQWPLECDKCGWSIAGILQQLGLEVKSSDSSICNVSTAMNSLTNSTSISRKTSLSLQYRDVFVLTSSFDLRDDILDEVENQVSCANGVVRGLRAAGVPVRVIRRGHESRDVHDTAVAQSDVVTVASYGDLQGLERKVVVWLPDRIPCVDEKKSDDIIDGWGMLYAMSRCTAQLVIVAGPHSESH